MKNYFLFCVGLWMVIFFSCSKKVPDKFALIGAWVLTKACLCNSCTDTIPSFNNKMLVFSSTSRVDLFGAVGNAQEHYSGTYSIIKESYGNVLSINLNSPHSNKNFLFVPGSIIQSVSGKNLILELNTPYACANVNTFTRE